MQTSKNITKHKYQTQFNWHNCLKPLVYQWKCQFLFIYEVLQGTIITCTGICISFTCFTWKRYKENKTKLHDKKKNDSSGQGCVDYFIFRNCWVWQSCSQDIITYLYFRPWKYLQKHLKGSQRENVIDFNTMHDLSN